MSKPQSSLSSRHSSSKALNSAVAEGRRSSGATQGRQTLRQKSSSVDSSSALDTASNADKRKAEIQARLAQIRSESNLNSTTSSLHSPSVAVVEKAVSPLRPFFFSLRAFSLVQGDDKSESNFTFEIGDSLTVTKDVKLMDEVGKKQLVFLNALKRISIPSGAVFTVTPDNNSMSPKDIIPDLQSPKEQINILERIFACDLTRRIYAGEKGKVLQIFSNLTVTPAEKGFASLGNNIPCITLPDGVLLEFIDGAQKYFSLTCVAEYIDAVPAVRALNPPEKGKGRVQSVPRQGLSIVEQRIKDIEEKEKKRKSEESRYESNIREMMAQPSLRASRVAGLLVNSASKKVEQTFPQKSVIQWNVPPPPPVIKKATMVTNTASLKGDDHCSPLSMRSSEIGDDSPQIDICSKRFEARSTSPEAPSLGNPKKAVKSAPGKSQHSTDISEELTKKVSEPSTSQTKTSEDPDKITYLCEEPTIDDERAVGESYVPIYLSEEKSKDGWVSSVPLSPSDGYVKLFNHRS